MFSWLRSRRAPRGIEPQLTRLEEQAARASPGYESQHLLRAADLCASAGEGQRALRYYGRVLDAYLETGRLAAAEALCQRMLETAPGAVRVRGTRMWLAATRASVGEFREAVADYVRTGTAAGQRGLVAHQLSLLAEASAEGMREIAAGALRELGAHAEADRWRGSSGSEAGGTAPPADVRRDPEWGERMLAAALLRPEQVRRGAGSRLHSAA